MEKLHPGTLTLDQQIDTLLLGRMKAPDERRHSLEEWGIRTNTAKGAFSGPWDTATEEMATYAEQDVVVGRAIWHAVKDVMAWGNCAEVEHKFAWIMHLQRLNGFRLDVPGAVALEADLRQQIHDEVVRLKAVFPPRYVRNGKGDKCLFTPKRPDRRAGYVAGATFCRVTLQEFNPTSRQQVGARLVSLGWVPKEFGDDGHPTVNEKILSKLPWPEAQQLVTLFRLTKKLGMLSDGKNGWLKLVTAESRVHGRVITTGAAPGRCSHSGPNMAQVDKSTAMRSLWVPRDGWTLVGCDGEGLQARILAGYLRKYDGGSYADKIVNGNKELKTDEHASNLKALPYLSAAFNFTGKPYALARDGAKRCLYCVLFGGRDPKLGQTLLDEIKRVGLPRPKLPTRELGALARQALFRAIKGFDKLSAEIDRVARTNRFLCARGGYHIPIRSFHSSLVFLMQGGEAAVMKLADVIWHFEVAAAQGWVHGVDYAYTVHVHDERQIECRPEIAEDIGRTYAQCVTEAGLRLGVKCPLAGSFAIGDNWSETH